MVGSPSNAVLLALSLAGTRWLGPERTAEAFARVGKLRLRAPRLRTARAPAAIAERVARGLALLPLPVECLDQAMVTWFRLNAAGHPATLRVGVKLTPLAGHAWVSLGDAVFVTTPGLEDYAVVGEYPPFASAAPGARRPPTSAEVSP